jgi:hypothetical protein
MANPEALFSDSDIERLVIEPGGGLSAFHLKVCPGFKLIQWSQEGTVLDLVLEDDALASATVNYLERMGVPQRPRGE